MPNYDYKCTSCGEVFEKFHGMNESPEIKCSQCGARAEKMIGAGAGIVFKGSGFYVTDYKKKDAAGKSSNTQKTEPKKETTKKTE